MELNISEISNEVLAYLHSMYCQCIRPFEQALASKFPVDGSLPA